MSVALDPADVARFRAWVGDRLGLSFQPQDAELLAAVLARRASVRLLSTPAYLRWLLADPPAAELAALVEELTITETYFFRHIEQLRALSEVVLPERLRARAGQRRLRLLSVACSSGEEAYTLAIVARQAVPDPDWDVTVLGVDANPAMLRRAAAGRYDSWSLRVTPPRIRHRWFRQHGGTFEVAGAIRQLVRFVPHNVTQDAPVVWPPGEYDAIFCRNLLMYLTPAARAALVARMTRALAPGGYLFLGHTDTLGSNPAGLLVRHSHDAFYYQRPPDAGAVPPGPATGSRATRSPATGPGTGSATWPGAGSGAEKATGTAGTGWPVEPVTAPAGTGWAGPRRPTARPTRWRHAVRLLQEERIAEALDLFEAASTEERADPVCRLLHAVLLAQRGRMDRARALCRELLASDALNPDAHHLLAVCLEEDDPAGAAEQHRLAAHLDPRFGMPRLRLGLLARRRGDHHTARTEFEHAIELLRDESEERVLFFGGGFGRHALIGLCRAELAGTGSRR